MILLKRQPYNGIIWIHVVQRTKKQILLFTHRYLLIIKMIRLNYISLLCLICFYCCLNDMMYSGYAWVSWKMQNSNGFATSSTEQSYSISLFFGSIGGRTLIPCVPFTIWPDKDKEKKMTFKVNNSLISPIAFTWGQGPLFGLCC